ncbi:MAG: hypothetical protein L3J59_11620, partial [Methylococcaceae bacterium]|nr:hypothetical protein [Methylococcaceae bacterium]
PLYSNGVASDIIDRKNRALVIKLSTHLVENTLTPVHEFFHLIQYGYTMFNNRWSLEGQSRWAEYAFRQGVGVRKKLPINNKAIEGLLNKAHKASSFWNRLTYLADKDGGEFNLPAPVTYVNSNKNLVQDNKLYGVQLVKRILENYQIFDEKVTDYYRLSRYGWTEKEQKSVNNNMYMLQAIKQSLEELKVNSAETDQFVNAIETYNKDKRIEENLNDYSDNVESIGNPFKLVFPDDIYARNVWDMQVFHNKIFLGSGNSSNHGPSTNTGPVTVISFNPEEEKFNHEYKVDEEQIDNFHVFNNILYIPGHDSTENWDFGNFYTYSNKQWKKYRNIKKGLHNYAMEFHKGQLFSALGTTSGASVAISNDLGETWTIQHMGKHRVYGFLKVSDKLFAIKPFLSSQMAKKLSTGKNSYFSVAEYDGNGQFIRRDDLTYKSMFPNSSLFYNKTKKIVKPLSVGGKTLYIGAYTHNDHQFKPFGVYLALIKKGKLEVKAIKLPDNYRPWDMVTYKDNVYLLIEDRYQNETKVKVLKSPISDLINWEKIVQFSSPTFARSFEINNKQLYFSLGSYLQNPLSWKQEELNGRTGEILRIKGVIH